MSFANYARQTIPLKTSRDPVTPKGDFTPGEKIFYVNHRNEKVFGVFAKYGEAYSKGSPRKAWAYWNGSIALTWVFETNAKRV